MNDPQQNDGVLQENVDNLSPEGGPTLAQRGISESFLAGPARQNRLERKVSRLSERELAEARQRATQNQYATRDKEIRERLIRQAQDEIRLSQIRQELQEEMQANTPLYAKGTGNLVKGVAKHAGTWTQERIGSLRPTRLIKNAVRAGLPIGKSLPYVTGEIVGVAASTEIPHWAIAAIGPTFLAGQAINGLRNIREIREMVSKANTPEELEQLLLDQIREREQAYPKVSQKTKEFLAGTVVGVVMGGGLQAGISAATDTTEFAMKYGETVAKLARAYGDDVAKYVIENSPEFIKEYGPAAAYLTGKGVVHSVDSAALRATMAFTRKAKEEEA
ncbi:MAG: hypothetical protein HY430_03985 [Candidatus Levybacteria bacterium]|nr:hypothetical protein [Candidatus Levybacteria bacterium]